MDYDTMYELLRDMTPTEKRVYTNTLDYTRSDFIKHMAKILEEKKDIEDKLSKILIYLGRRQQLASGFWDSDESVVIRDIMKHINENILKGSDDNV